jgi:hypothetical protein
MGKHDEDVCGVGIFLEESDGGLIVAEVMEDGPANGRLFESDLVRAIVDSSNRWLPTAGLSARQVGDLIVGTRGTPITLIVERKNGQAPSQRHSVTMTRGAASFPKTTQIVVENLGNEQRQAQRGVLGESCKIFLPEPSEEHHAGTHDAPSKHHAVPPLQAHADMQGSKNANNEDTSTTVRLMAEQVQWTSSKLDEAMAELYRTLEKLRVRDEEASHYKRRCKDLENEVETLKGARDDVEQVKRELDFVKLRVAGAHEEVLHRQMGEVRVLEERNQDLESEILKLQDESDSLRQTCSDYAGRCMDLEGMV